MVEYVSFNDLFRDIRQNIHRLNEEQYDLVVGIPRSGMIPAYQIALYLNLNCTDINALKENRILQHGITRSVKKNFKYPQEAQKILLVDDSIHTGKSLKKILDTFPLKLRAKITTLAIYSSQRKRNDVDVYFKYIPMPRVFEWNIFHHNILSLACVDIDGVLCVDPTDAENDDGENYKKFLLNAKPLFIPSSKIYALVTSRLEKYRKETEIWLKKHNIKYDKLIMLDLPSMKERRKLGLHALHKAQFYKDSEAVFFIESNSMQAKTIRDVARKDVYCTETNVLYSAKFVNIIKENPYRVRWLIKEASSKIFKKLKFF